MKSLRTLFRKRHGSTSLEFAAIALPFVALLLFVLELSYDLFSQEALDAALHTAARQIATGNAQNVQNGATFVSQYLCPDLAGLLKCDTNLYVKVDRLQPNDTQDYYTYTTGDIPVSGLTLNLNGYGSANFCNAGPTELLLVSAIYVGPSFIGGLFPGLLSEYQNGLPVHATLSTVGVVSEGYPLGAAPPGTPVAPGC